MRLSAKFVTGDIIQLRVYKTHKINRSGLVLPPPQKHLRLAVVPLFLTFLSLHLIHFGTFLKLIFFFKKKLVTDAGSEK